MEVKNRLLNFDNKIIYQNDEWFLFSLDSVLLANFVNINFTDKKIIDFCTGNAPVPMLLSYKTNNEIIGVELQKKIYDLAVKSIKENELEDRIKIINEDVNNLSNIYEAESFDIITCNPPYFKTKNSELLNNNDIKTIARHEVKLNLEEILKQARYLLKNGKKLVMVHRPDRLIEIINIMKKYNFEPKRIKLCYPKEKDEANILLIEAVKNGKSGLKVESPLIVHNDDGSYTDVIRAMFEEWFYVAN